MKFPLFASRALGSSELFLKKNGPGMLTTVGVAGFIASTALTIRATTKAVDVLPAISDKVKAAKEAEITDGFTEHDKMREVVTVYGQSIATLAKIYAPALLTGSVSIVCVVSAHGMMKHRQASLLAAYAALDAGFRAYRGRIAEEFGSDKELELYRAVRTRTIEDDEGLPCEIVDDRLPSPYAKFFDEYSTHWTKTPEYNLMFLRSTQDWANDRMHAYGFIFLNEVYEALGLPRTQAGQVVGWRKDGDGDGFVDFGLYNLPDENGRAFVNGVEGVVLLDFNVDGPVKL
jgi:Family of unknown function (DUF6353)